MLSIIQMHLTLYHKYISENVCVNQIWSTLCSKGEHLILNNDIIDVR